MIRTTAKWLVVCLGCLGLMAAAAAADNKNRASTAAAKTSSAPAPAPAAAKPAADADGAQRIDPARLDADIQAVKLEVLSLANDLSMLDSGVLSINGNQLTIYLSLDVDDGFELQAVDLEMDGKFAARREFNEQALIGLRAGGIRRLWVNNLPAGDYQLKASMIGKVGKGKDHRGNTTFTVHKSDAPKSVELKIVNYRQKFVPDFDIVERE